MLRRPLQLAKATALVLAAFSMAACEVQFTPQVTPLVLVTAAGSPHAFGTVGAAGTASPLDVSATAEAELILTIVAFAQQEPSPNRRGDRRVASYEEVWCGDITRVCYELCFQNECGIYDISNPRVAQFVAAVDSREDEIIALESEARTQRRSGVAAFVSCAGTLLAGGGAYALVTAVDPEPVSKTLLAVGGAIVAGVACGGSLFSYADSGTEVSIHEQELQRQGLVAEQAFEYLRQYGEEVDLDGPP
jgi:hypothetical protein